MSKAESELNVAFVPEIAGKPQLRDALEQALDIAKARYPAASYALTIALDRRSKLLDDYAQDVHQVAASGLNAAKKNFLFRY